MKFKRAAVVTATSLGVGLLSILSITHYSDVHTDAKALVPAVPTQALIEHGAYLAKLGDCAACHSVAGQPEFSGGLKMHLPIGDIYSTNITSDPQFGIGKYSLTDFDRALRYGVARGHTLYPAMPFVSYANTTDEDVQALYAYFLHGVTAAAIPNRHADIAFPLSLRFPLTVWRWAFAPAPKPFDFARFSDGDISRGAYFVEGLGHCGECHTPRGPALEMKSHSPTTKTFLAGAVVDDYYAPSLRSDGRESLADWDVAQLASFLKTGVNPSGIAFGSMTEVIEHSTQYMSAADLLAAAKYLKSITATDSSSNEYDDATARSLAAGDLKARGATTYIDNCAACHRPDGHGYEGVFPSLAGNPVVESSNPLSLATIVLKGSTTAHTGQTPAQFTMPAFAWRLDDQEIADVLTFVRSGWGNKAAAVDKAIVAKLRTDPW
jgi:mono/diheme cytochrome c family protein